MPNCKSYVHIELEKVKVYTQWVMSCAGYIWNNLHGLQVTAVS